jgi:hypothetical protein
VTLAVGSALIVGPLVTAAQASESLPSYLTSFTGAATPAGSFATLGGIAVDQSTGDLYVLDVGHNIVDKFTANGGYICQISGEGSASSSHTECQTSKPGPGGFLFPNANVAGIDVDNSATDGHQGELLVPDRGHHEATSASSAVRASPSKNR